MISEPGTMFRKKFTYAECRESANHWKNRAGFKSNHRARYEFAKAMEWLNDISTDLGWKIPTRAGAPKMTDDEIKKVCSEFLNKTHLKVSNRRVYDIARVRNLLGEIFK